MFLIEMFQLKDASIRPWGSHTHKKNKNNNLGSRRVPVSPPWTPAGICGAFLGVQWVPHPRAPLPQQQTSGVSGGVIMWRSHLRHNNTTPPRSASTLSVFFLFPPHHFPHASPPDSLWRMARGLRCCQTWEMQAAVTEEEAAAAACLPVQRLTVFQTNHRVSVNGAASHG